MSEIVLSPDLSVGYGSLILSDGDRELDLVGAPPDGIYLVTFNPPALSDANTFTSSPDTEGQLRTRTQPENPSGTGTLRIDQTQSNAASLWDDADNLQDLFREAHRRQGTLAYTPPGGREVTFDLVAVRISEWTHNASLQQRWLECAFEFTCRPYGRLAPRSLLSAVTLAGPIDSVELEGVGGHADAFGEATFTDETGQPRDDVEWGIAETFDTADPIRLEADDLVVSGYSGTFDTDHVEGDIQTDWLALCGLGTLPHAGRYRIKAWLNTETTDVQARLAWQVGSEPLRLNPDNFAVPHLSDRLIEVDLGLVNVPEVVGWSAQIELKAGGSGHALSVYAVEIIPAGRYGRARSPVSNATPATYAASDAFNQAAADLDGLVATSGGAWDTYGATDDFSVEDTGHSLVRVTSSETFGIPDARHAVLGSDAAAQTARVDLTWGAFSSLLTPSTLQAGLILRSDGTADNCLACVIVADQFGGYVKIAKVLAGVETTLATAPPAATPFLAAAGFTYKLAASADAFGNVIVTIGDSGFTVTAQDDDLATGGTLASGQAGIVDNFYDTGGPIRSFDNFATWAPPADHVIWPDETLRLTHDAAQRSNGVPFGDVPFYEGKRLLIPPATRNGRSSRLVVKQDRNDLTVFPVADDGDELTLDLEVVERVALTTQSS